MQFGRLLRSPARGRSGRQSAQASSWRGGKALQVLYGHPCYGRRRQGHSMRRGGPPGNGYPRPKFARRSVQCRARSPHREHVHRKRKPNDDLDDFRWELEEAKDCRRRRAFVSRLRATPSSYIRKSTQESSGSKILAESFHCQAHGASTGLHSAAELKGPQKGRAALVPLNI